MGLKSGSDLPQPGDRLRQSVGIPFRQIAVAQVQGGQRQIRGTGGAEQGQCGLGVLPEARRGVFADVQIRAAGEDRQGLVGGVAADVRTQVQRMDSRGQKMQIGAVGVVNCQYGIVAVADLRQRGNIRHAAQIVRAGEIDGGRRLVQLRQRFLQTLRRCRTAAEGLTVPLRPEPDHLKVQQRRRIDEGLVDISGGHDDWRRPGWAAGQGQIQHGPDALAGALR